MLRRCPRQYGPSRSRDPVPFLLVAVPLVPSHVLAPHFRRISYMALSLVADLPLQKLHAPRTTIAPAAIWFIGAALRCIAPSSLISLLLLLMLMLYVVCNTDPSIKHAINQRPNVMRRDDRNLRHRGSILLRKFVLVLVRCPFGLKLRPSTSSGTHNLLLKGSLELYRVLRAPARAVHRTRRPNLFTE